ncbi:MAG: hypothetical protein QW350_00750 [Candidatus Aenigmatarchaeota archaeon]
MISLEYIESLYIASCHPYKDRPYADLAEDWKKKIMKGERQIPEEEFAKAFPHAYKIYRSGRLLQDYFESLNEGSHNWLLWMFLVNAQKRLPLEVLSSILVHTEYCCVKVGRRDDKIYVPSLTGEYEFSRDQFNFLCEESEYYFLHGFDGKIYAIRPASKEDFERFEEWFNEKRKSILKSTSSCPLPQLYQEISF